MKRDHYRLACTGTVDPSGLVGPLIEQSLEVIEAKFGVPSLLVTGSAHGVDTIWIQMAAARWRRTAIMLIAPDAPHNEDLYHLLRAMHNGRSIARTRLLVMPRAPNNAAAYMQRNDQVQHHADVLSAHPKQRTEVIRSGSWATIRRFRKRDKPVWLSPVHPDAEAGWM